MQIDEFIEILQSDTPSDEVKRNEDRIFSILPSLRRCKEISLKNDKTNQVYSIYDHILNVVDNVENDIVLRLAALFHDVGKPEAYESRKANPYESHAFFSRIIFEAFAKRCNLASKLEDEKLMQICNLISYHDSDFSLLDENAIEDIKKYFPTQEDLENLFKFKQADLLASDRKITNAEIDELFRQMDNVLSRYGMTK